MTVAAPIALVLAQHVKTTTAAAVYSRVQAAAEASAPAALMTTKGVLTVMKKNLEKTKEPAMVPRRPTALRVSPTAWAKLLFLRDAGDTEIGGFGISATDDLLFVVDVQLVQQTCTWVHVAFNDEAVANFFDEQVDSGRRPDQFARLWIHTHPGNSPEPSGTDEATFTRVFGRSDWAVMFILARGGHSFARLRYNVGPGVDVKLPVEIDYGRPFAGSAEAFWHDEYLANVRMPASDSRELLDSNTRNSPSSRADGFQDDWWRDVWGEYVDFDRVPQETEYGYDRDF
jgi:proteasome lid subunit RPN8/RPN11